MSQIYLTKHARLRFKQRTNISATQRAANSAFRYGKISTDFKEPVKSYLDSISSGFGRYIAKVHKNNIYIFENNCGHKLLTVYNVPEDYLPINNFEVEVDELHPVFFQLTNKENPKEVLFWSENGLTSDIAEALEFKNQKRAANYLNNNFELKLLKKSYIIKYI